VSKTYGEIELFINSAKDGRVMFSISSHAIPPVGSKIYRGENEVYEVREVIFHARRDKSGLHADWFTYHVLVNAISNGNGGDLLISSPVKKPPQE